MRMIFVLLCLLWAQGAQAQSDTRKVAVWVTSGTSGQGTDRTTGNSATASGTGGLSKCHSVMIELLEQMGVPYDVFLFPDSANWGTSSATPTKADSTWFREQGYLGCAYCQRGMDSGNSFEAVEYFTDAAGNRGNQTGSLVDGNWGIPTVVFGVDVTSRSAAAGFENGAFGESSPSIESRQKGAFANGDSLEWFCNQATKDPSQTVTVQAWGGDTLDGTATAMKAWRHRNSTYYYSIGSGPPGDAWNSPVPILLGLAKLFEHAGYKPRQKLVFHLTVDHPAPTSQRRALSDTFFTYVREGNWKFTAAIKAHTSEQIESDSDINTAFRPWKEGSNPNHWVGHPHSHINGVGNYHFSDWNFATYADTATLYARWRFMEQAIRDTMLLPMARGYERTAMLPGGSMSFPHLYGLAQLGYSAVRAAPNPDSIGLETTNQQVSSGQGQAGRPFLFVEPKSAHPGKAIWVVANISHPGSDDTTWSQVPNQSTNVAYIGRLAQHFAYLTVSIVWDNDFFWHGQENLEGPDEIISPFARRYLYLFNRLKDICEWRASFQPRIPRRHNANAAAP